MKNLSICLSIVCVGLSIFSYRTYNENFRLQLISNLNREEIGILKYEAEQLQRLPSYEQGCKDTIIKMGANGTEAWNSGYDSAVSLLANSSYADGYHNAIFQFNYQKPDTSRYLVPEPKKNEKDTETAKVTKN